MEDNKDLFIAGVLALVVFELWKIYEDNAPSLAICRAAETSSEKSDVKRQINDSDIAVGTGLAVVAGVFAYHTKEAKVIVLPAVILVGLSLYRRVIVDSTSTTTPR